jgi:hypothetical protein
MRFEISIGEAIDKLSILELKNEKINDPNKKTEIQKEIAALQECTIYKKKYEYYYKLLMHVNEIIWIATDNVKTMQVDDKNYAATSKQMFDFNQKRYRIKNFFNILTESHIKEQKSYVATKCKINIENEDILYEKIPEINYLTLEYDYVLIEMPYLSIIKTILQAPNIILSESEANHIIELKDFSIDHRDIYELPPIKYISGGKFGDFLNQLSVINENFYKTGRKGILYIANIGDIFVYGLDHTYADTYEIIMSQKYIKEYKKYNNEQCDSNLSNWRDRVNLLFTSRMNWYGLYKTIYAIEWGKHKWLNVTIDKKWENIVFISMTSYRFRMLDYSKIYSLYGKLLIFISPDPSEYENFKNRTNLEIEYYQPLSFKDLCIAINSCKLLISGLSAILVIATACHKACIAFGHPGVEMLYANLNIPNITYNP